MKTLVATGEPEDRPPFGPQVTLSATTNSTSAVIVWSNPMPSFVCGPCKKGDHSDCPGGTQCDCQHKEQPRG